MEKIKEVFQTVKHVFWDKARDLVAKHPNVALATILALALVTIVGR